MVGVAVGLGNIWRFPYMVGKFGGAPFVFFYVFMVMLVGIPALTAEWILGRHTRRGPVGAFARVGLPGGRAVGWLFFLGVTAASAYYTNAIGWVLYYTVGQAAGLFGASFDPSLILPPAQGFEARSLILQMLCTGSVILGCSWIALRGLRRGIEPASKVLIPLLVLTLSVLLVRSLTLPGAWEGVEWYILKFDLDAFTPSAMVAALGQAVFSLSLGGTFMVAYGSYIRDDEELVPTAAWTATGDLLAGLLAGLAILPAVFALGLEPNSGPGLLFFTLPEVFQQIPAGQLFGLLFFTGLLGAALLSDVAAFEVLAAGLSDNFGWSRRRAVGSLAVIIFLFAIPPMINMRIFEPWDLTFGSGFQTLGALLAVISVAFCIDRAILLEELGGRRWLVLWLRFGVPWAMLLLGIWWLISDVLGWITPG